jgi:hypothetical protein
VTLYAIAVLSASACQDKRPAFVLLIAAGAAWMMVNNTNLSAIQTAIPSWIRARVMAIYLLVFSGSMAAGGMIWGTLATAFGTRGALALSAANVLATLLVLRRIPAHMGNAADATLAGDSGCALPPTSSTTAPVAVEIRYRLRPEWREEFHRAVHARGRSRRRDGAAGWRLDPDPFDHAVYMERFAIASWHDYLRLRSRATVADRALDARIAACLIEGTLPEVQHYFRDEPGGRS